jgi:hypothetical protein
LKLKKLILVVSIIMALASFVHAAAVAPTVDEFRKLGLWGDWKITWSGITTTNNTCTALTNSVFSGIEGRLTSMTVQATGTWGGGTIALFGSNDGTTWFALTSLETSSAISLTADGFKTILQSPVAQVKWTLSGGDGTTNIKVIIQGQR